MADWNTIGDSSERRSEAHWTMAAVLAADLRVAVRWGNPHASDFMAEWLAQGAVESAESHWVDLLYCGQPVDSMLRLRVNGVGIPVPVADASGLWVPAYVHRLFMVLNAFEGSGGLDEALATFGVVVR